jgi:exodeoxyribonuclease V gamma subunit
VAAHLAPRNGDRSRRLRTVQHLATLFDRYATYRPDMLQAWREGRDGYDTAGAQLGPRHRWQAELWRRVRRHLDRPDPVETLAEACTRIVADPALLDLPERLAIFGLTALPGRHLQVLHALATGRDVHLFLLHPSAASWEATANAITDRGDVPLSRAHAGELLPAHPLLASWGRDARELQLVLAREGPEAPTITDTHYPSSDADATTLLTRIQAGVRADDPPARPGTGTADQRPTLSDDDRSIEIHACHGRARQVEVLRDAILHALEEDPTLEPRDIIVMCPDIEAFAPLVEATFGAGEALAETIGPERSAADLIAPSTVRGAGLRVRLADRALRQTNPVLALITRLLELATARITASEVLDLADREPVRRRFRLERDDLSQLEDWVTTGGIRWGLDAEHRGRFQLSQLGDGTWHAGLDRIATGTALAEDGPTLFAGVLPLDDVDSSSIDLGGRFAELVDRLQAVIDDFTEPKTIAAWATAIANAADALGATLASDAWQRGELEWVLQDVLAEATTGDTPSPAPLDVADVAALLSDRLAGRPTRANFRTGHLTVCTLQPMRSVPHRVVCLLGLDDTAFPRRSRRDGDDVLLLGPHVGDRDPRAEDRQILLDALLAATHRLIITYTGNDERTNAPRSPAVAVGELLDVADRTARCADGTPAGTCVLVRHPLQDFDARNFEPGAIRAATPWSFDATTLEGARAIAADRMAPPSFLDRPLAWVRILLLSATYPERPFSATTVGRARRSVSRSATVTVTRIPPLGDDASSRRARALQELETLTDLYGRGMREPLPIFCETSAAYAAGALVAARTAWESPFGQEHEDRDELHVLVFGRDRPFEWLLTHMPRDDECGEGWDENEASRFGRLTQRLWAGLRAIEQVSDV